MNITEEGFIRVAITPEMVERATLKAKDLGVLRNSIREGKGNLVGFLGEEIVLASLPDATSTNTFQHDVSALGVTFEVKSKDRTVDPRLDYEASIANFNSTQSADFYMFVSVYRDKGSNTYTHGHVIGMMARDEYKLRARFLRVGDIDPSNGWTVKANCYNLRYGSLTRFDSLRQQ